jgi:hypothetical protein
MDTAYLSFLIVYSLICILQSNFLDGLRESTKSRGDGVKSGRIGYLRGTELAISLEQNPSYQSKVNHTVKKFPSFVESEFLLSCLHEPIIELFCAINPRHYEVLRNNL